MEPEGSLPCLHVPTTNPYPEPDQSSPYPPPPTCFLKISLHNVVWDSAVGIATRLELDGPGSNPNGGENFRSRPDPPWGPQWVPGLFRGGGGVALTTHPFLAPRLTKE